ncbi:SCO2522 family protein [Streptomyces sp. V4-01]|uniref:SCO2522 family protein n=1 Tax=Actinacidiphila polyblastidii TaxID=3110430 RepID=A0ABU7PB69_9ACTN|nr:SCO2522 family protein [Streptomyces sp. V4-01]
MTGERTGGVFRETTAEPRTRAVPLAHVSLELGHFATEDFKAGPERLRAHFARIRPWADAARAVAAAGARRPRVSTCLLVDDYRADLSPPAALLPVLIAEAGRAGLVIDYLARESGCAVADGVRVAEEVEARLVESPPPGSDGSRPPVGQTGWLANGRRTPGVRTVEAMADAPGWRPPAETATRRHSIFVDAELWDEEPGARRRWSCAFLAAVWQLARLGLLRHFGDPVLQPVPWTVGADFPGDWDTLPPLIRINPSAAPFSAYRTCSVLPSRLLPVEHAVRVVLDQVDVEPRALHQVAARALDEGLPVPEEISDRISYVFHEGP